jgi:hypothetical protein
MPGPFLGVLTGDANNGLQTPVVAVTPSASPFTYTAPSRGTLNIAGGTISAIALVRQGVSTALSTTAGHYPMALGDQLKITYSAAPTLNFVPI